MVANVVALGEMDGEQSFHDGVGTAVTGGQAHQPVGVNRGRGAPDAIEGKGDALALAEFADGRIQAFGAFLAAEFADHVIRAGHAASGHVGVQQEGPPGQIEQQIGAAVEGAQQPLHPQVTPGADQVVDDLDGDAGFGWGKGVHGTILIRLPRNVTRSGCQASRPGQYWASGESRMTVLTAFWSAGDIVVRQRSAAASEFWTTA